MLAHDICRCRGINSDIGDYLPEMRKQHIPKPGVALTIKPAKQNISIGKTDMHRTTRIMRANI